MSRTIRRPNGDGSGFVSYKEQEFKEWKEWSKRNNRPHRYTNWRLARDWDNILASKTYKDYVRRCKHYYHRDHGPGWTRPPFDHKYLNRVYRARCKDTLVRVMDSGKWDEFLIPRCFKDEMWFW